MKKVRFLRIWKSKMYIQTHFNFLCGISYNVLAIYNDIILKKVALSSFAHLLYLEPFLMLKSRGDDSQIQLNTK